MIGEIWFSKYSVFWSSFYVSFIPSLNSLSVPCNVLLQLSHLYLSLPSHMHFPCLLRHFLQPLLNPNPLLFLSFPAPWFLCFIPFQLPQRWLIRCIYRKTDWMIRINQEWWCSLLQTVAFIISPEWEHWTVGTVVHHMQRLTLLLCMVMRMSVQWERKGAWQRQTASYSSGLRTYQTNPGSK